MFLDPRRVSSILQQAGFGGIRERYLTPEFSPAFLTPKNKVLAHLLYAAAGLGRGGFTQSFFLLSATKA